MWTATRGQASGALHWPLSSGAASAETAPISAVRTDEQRGDPALHRVILCPGAARPPSTKGQVSDAARRDRGGGGGVDLDGVAHVLRVAAREHDADVRAGRAQPVEHELVAGAQAGLGEREAAEAVALPRVGAREVERDLGRAAVERLVERVVERLEVVGVAGAGGQVDVEVGGDALERVVARAVERERVRVRVGARAGRRCRRPGGRRSRPPARAPPGPRRAAAASVHDDVVEEAVAAGERAAGVVGAAAEVHRDAVRRARGAPPPACPPPSGGRARPAPATTAARGRAARAGSARRRGCAAAASPSWTRSSSAHATGSVSWISSGVARPELDDPPAQQRVLGEREAVARGQREARAVVSPELHLG